jgi:hypothetical protein
MSRYRRTLGLTVLVAVLAIACLIEAVALGGFGIWLGAVAMAVLAITGASDLRRKHRDRPLTEPSA